HSTSPTFQSLWCRVLLCSLSLLGLGCHWCSGPRQLCHLAPERGRCRRRIYHYAYNPALRSCWLFVYGGRRGNANNFLTIEECRVPIPIPSQSPFSYPFPPPSPFPPPIPIPIPHSHPHPHPHPHHSPGVLPDTPRAALGHPSRPTSPPGFRAVAEMSPRKLGPLGAARYPHGRN
uniref:BPTI/Kunitz inhibitor domain-containing protein n=1 Tax=Meleagris gallopavo TaxID=9103 RepID=A0A803XL85_MELGA